MTITPGQGLRCNVPIPIGSVVVVVVIAMSPITAPSNKQRIARVQSDRLRWITRTGIDKPASLVHFASKIIFALIFEFNETETLTR